MEQEIDTQELGEKIVKVLKTIYDPEIPVDIYELGLIYDVMVSTDYDVKILMTLTTPNCPVAESLPREVEEKVKSIICEQLGIGEDEVKADKNFVDDLGADSLDIVELVMAMEEQFEIEIPDEDAEKIQSVNDAVTYIQQHS